MMSLDDCIIVIFVLTAITLAAFYFGQHVGKKELLKEMREANKRGEFNERK